MTATTLPETTTAPTVAPPQTLVGTRPSRTREARRRLVAWLKDARGHGVWILIWSIVSWVGTAWSPLLLERPVLLMALAPRATFVVLAAPHLDLWTFVLLGTVRLSLTDGNWFIVGRRFPERGAAKAASEPKRFPLARVVMRFTDRMCRWLAGRALVAGIVLFLRPNGKYLGVAGAYGVNPWVAGISSISGTILYLTAVHQGIAALF